jgi:LysM repeat protein
MTGRRPAPRTRRTTTAPAPQHERRQGAGAADGAALDLAALDLAADGAALDLAADRRADDAVVDAGLTGLEVLLIRARLTAASGAACPTPGRTSLTLRSAGIPLLAAAVVGSGATTAGAETPRGASPLQPSRSAGRTPVAGAVPQAGSHASAALVTATVTKKASPPVVTYVVRSGDTLSDIAHRARISLAALTRANHLRATDIIRPGQRLVLPGVRPPAAHRKARPPKPVVHVVKAGETVSGIAHRYKITVAAIVRANRLRPDALIHPGRKLVLPGVRPKPAKRPAPTHVRVVRAGDTLSAIAVLEKVTLRRLLSLNHLRLRSVIHPGQRLLVPGPPPVPNTFAGRTYPDAVARAAAANRAVLARRAVPTRAAMRRTITATARKYRVPESLALAVAYQESGFNQRAVSPANAIGTMQVIPSSGVWASRLVGRRLDLLDPQDNVTAGVAILAALRRTADDERSAIAGYYQGLASVNRNGMFPDTRRYVANIQRLQTRFTPHPR